MKLCRLMLGLALCLTLCACAPEPGPAAGDSNPKSAVGQEQPEEPPVQPVSPEKPMPEEEGTKPAEPTGPVPEKPSEPQEPELPAEPAEDGEEILYYRSTGKTPPDGVELPEIPAWDALPKEDRNDYVHRDYGFQVVDSEGNPLPGVSADPDGKQYRNRIHRRIQSPGLHQSGWKRRLYKGAHYRSAAAGGGTRTDGGIHLVRGGSGCAARYHPAGLAV